MMPHHARCVNAMSIDVIDYLLHYFDCRRPRAGDHKWYPTHSLAERNAGQVDCVLALLQVDEPHFRRAAEWLIGREIRYVPLALRNLMPMRPVEEPDCDTPDRRRIEYVVPVNPRRGTTGAAVRFTIMREGRTLEQCFVRGLTRRDAREAIDNGWVRVCS